MDIRAERIKALLRSSNLSYQDLEKLTNIKKSSLQRYASGKTQKIPMDAIEKLSAAFDVSPAYLMGWDITCLLYTSSVVETEVCLLILVIAEKPSVAQSIATVLGATSRKDG